MDRQTDKPSKKKCVDVSKKKTKYTVCAKMNGDSDRM